MVNGCVIFFSWFSFFSQITVVCHLPNIFREFSKFYSVKYFMGLYFAAIFFGHNCPCLITISLYYLLLSSLFDSSNIILITNRVSLTDSLTNNVIFICFGYISVVYGSIGRSLRFCHLEFDKNVNSDGCRSENVWYLWGNLIF